MSDQPSVPTPVPPSPEVPVCDVCGSPRLVWRTCKLVCEDCRSINKSCADL